MGILAKASLLGSTFARRARPLLRPSTLYSAAYPADAVALTLFEGEWASKLPGFAHAGAVDLFAGDDCPHWMARAACADAASSSSARSKAASLQGGSKTSCPSSGKFFSSLSGAASTDMAQRG